MKLHSERLVSVPIQLILFTLSDAILKQKTELLSNKMIFFLLLHENICCGYSLEVPRQGTSNEYAQRMFSWRNKTYIYLIPALI